MAIIGNIHYFQTNPYCDIFYSKHMGMLMIFELWRPKWSGQATGSVETSLPLVYSAALEGQKNQQASRLIGQMVKLVARMTEISCMRDSICGQLANKFLDQCSHSCSPNFYVAHGWGSKFKICVIADFDPRSALHHHTSPRLQKNTVSLQPSHFCHPMLGPKFDR